MLCEAGGGGGEATASNPSLYRLSTSAPYSEGSLMPPPVLLRIETSIAYAHRALSRARDEASSLRDLGLHDDLQLMTLELERLQVDLLRSGVASRVRPIRPSVSQTDKAS